MGLRAYILAQLAAFGSYTQTIYDYDWTQITASGPFAARDGAGALVLSDALYLIGGWNPDDAVHFPADSKTNNEVWKSLNGTDWTCIKANTYGTVGFDGDTDWEGRHTAGYVTFQGKLWIVGGDANAGHYHYDVWNSSDGITWTKVNTENVPWGPRVLHHTVVLGDKIFVIGGQTRADAAAADDVLYNDVWSSPDGINWTQVCADAPWTARGMIGGGCVLGGKIWLLGGGTYQTPAYPDRLYYNEIWSSPDGIAWTLELPSAPWVARSYHDVCVFDGEMWLLEGAIGNTNRKDVWHSPDGKHWIELTGTPWDARHASSIFVVGDALYVVVGNNMTADVWKLQRAA